MALGIRKSKFPVPRVIISIHFDLVYVLGVHVTEKVLITVVLSGREIFPDHLTNHRVSLFLSCHVIAQTET